MTKIYGFSWPSGMYGHFLIKHITSDPNYYPPLPKNAEFMAMRESKYNSYESSSVLEHLKIWIDQDPEFLIPPHITDEMKEQADIQFSEKNVCTRMLHAHGQFPINLNRLQRVRLYVTDSTDLLMAFLMKVIKTYSLSVPQWNHTWWEEYIPKKAKVKQEWIPILLEDVSKISFLEIDMTYAGFDVLSEYIPYMFNEYSNQATDKIKYNDWVYLNPAELFKNPEAEMPKWKETLDLQNDFDFSELRAYHQRNLDLIHREFGKSFDEIANGDYINDTIEYCTKYLHFYPR